MEAEAGNDCTWPVVATGNIKGFSVLVPDGNLRILRWRLLNPESPSGSIGTPQAGAPVDDVDMNDVGLEEDGPVRVPKDVQLVCSSVESE